jgi:hypothetical protein
MTDFPAITFADQTEIELAAYTRADQALASVRTGQMLTAEQAVAQRIVAQLTPDCPLNAEDGVHNIDLVSAPFELVSFDGKTTTMVTRKCTCGLIEGTDYVVS